MIEVVVVGEGQTEETFVREVMAPALWGLNISLQPRLIRTSNVGRGGALTRDRVLRFLRNTLRERGDTYVTTLFDLSGLDAEFPGVQECVGVADPIERAACIEVHLVEVVVELAACRAGRFLPHIQPHEFEALLFANVAKIVDVEPEWASAEDELQRVRSAARSPEHINDGSTTQPSARLAILNSPRYRKVLHGPLIAEHIGLGKVREECTHFAGWIARLEGLPPE